jgi:hypothetical protein
MVLPLLFVAGTILWALGKDKGGDGVSRSSLAGEENENVIVNREKQWLKISTKELDAAFQRYGEPENILREMKDSLADKTIRSDFFLFLRVMTVNMWIEGYEERGCFVHPEDQTEQWMQPMEWAQFPEFYDVAIQPRLSSDSLDLAFMLRLSDRYPNISQAELFGGTLNIYLKTYATLDSLAGREIYERYTKEHESHLNINDPAYHKIRREVNSELGLNKSFKEILDRYYGDCYRLFDSIAEALST